MHRALVSVYVCMYACSVEMKTRPARLPSLCGNISRSDAVIHGRGCEASHRPAGSSLICLISYSPAAAVASQTHRAFHVSASTTNLQSCLVATVTASHNNDEKAESELPDLDLVLQLISSRQQESEITSATNAS